MIPSSNLVRSNQARTSADVGAVDGFGKEVIEADSAIFPVWNGRNITYGVAIAKCPLLGHSALASLVTPCTVDHWHRLEQDRRAKSNRLGETKPRAGRDGTAEGFHRSAQVFACRMSAHPD